LSDDLKRIGDPLGELHAPILGEDGKGAHRSARDVVIVNLPDHFDINDVFRSEEEPAEAPSPQAMTPPAAVESRPAPEPIAPDREKGPSLSIADLIDNHVRLEWHEAVAIAQHLCSVMVRDPAANVHHSLVEPWNVEITKAGDIRVLPGGSSSDPLVKQVGRVLHTLLQGSIAPAELRLVASQASFEVPVFASVEELSAALRRFERPGDLDAIRAAFNRGLEAKFSIAPTAVRVAAPAAALPAGDSSEKRTDVVVTSWVDSSQRSRSLAVSRPVLAATAAILATAVLMVGLWMWTSEPKVERSPVQSPIASVPSPPVRQAETPPASPARQPEIAPRPAAPAVALSPSRPLPTDVAPAAPRRAPRLLAVPPTVNVIAPPSPRSTPPTIQRSVVSGTSDFLEAERRASVLFASGRTDEAALVIDSIVLKNPFYQLDPARSSPEALTAVRNSKRVFFPVLIRRHYQEARTAFDAGDFSLAVAKGERALALLNDGDADASSADLSAEVSNLVALATAARTREEERVYTLADLGVTPPRPLGRQLASPSAPRRSVSPTGRLEILVDRSGRVETVRLETPLNGYHDRMIVSAVKAWHYKPALRNGKPVRFNLVMSITLPDM
jgi:hypothetical protein